MAAVEVEDLVIRYGSLTAVDGLSFTADAGRVTVVLGPNGAGKTSTIECLEGYREATTGRVRVAGLDPHRDHRQLVHRIGVMLQDGGVYPGIKVKEAAALFCALYGHRHRPDELIELVGLGDRRSSPWRRLSGGEQRRLSLALALVGDPEVAFLDEPTSGVDVGGRQIVRQIVRSLADRGTAVLLTTHELAEAERVADRVVIVDRGRLVATGTPTELMAAGDQIRFGAEPGLDVAALGAFLHAVVEEVAPGDYAVAAAPEPATVAALTAWLAERNLALRDLRAGRQSLEDVFLRLTSDPER